MTTSHFVLGSDSARALSEAVKAESGARNKLKKCSDSLMSDGVTSSMLAKPSKGEANKFEALHNQINDIIIGTFSKTVQDIMAMPATARNDEQKETNRYWRQQVNSLFSKVRAHLTKTEKELLEGSTPIVQRSKLEIIHDKLVEVREMVQKWKNPELGCSVNDFLSNLELLIAETH